MIKKRFKDKDPKAEHYSSWLITINTNSTDRRLIGPLRKTWRYITEHMQDFAQTVIPGAKLLQVGTKPAMEIGSDKHRIHLHDQLILKSEGICYLNYGAIRAFIKKQLDRFDTFENEYFQAQLVKNFNASIYISAYNDKDRDIDLNEPEIDFEIIL